MASMPRRRNPKNSASKRVEKSNKEKKINNSGFDLDLSALTKYNWTVEKANALLGSMIGLKPAGIHKHLSMLFIEERLFEKINEHIPTTAIWEFIYHHWDIDAADKLEAQVILPIETKDFCLPQTKGWAQLIEEEEKSILLKQESEKDNSDMASTSNVSSDNTNKTLISYDHLSNATQALITHEEFKRMTSVKVMIEKLKSLPNNASETELSVLNKEI